VSQHSLCAGYLEGIKSKDRAILKLNKVGFKYPGMEKNVISSVTGQFSLNSRVAVIGPNGAGKSTMIKILTGEIEALEGIVWKHPNLRVAYVAQHAFHHIEQVRQQCPMLCCSSSGASRLSIPLHPLASCSFIANLMLDATGLTPLCSVRSIWTRHQTSIFSGDTALARIESSCRKSI